MKIALVMCPIWNIDQPPLSTAYIAGQLKSVGHNVSCYDFSIDLLHLPADERTIVTQKYLVESWYDNFAYWREKLSLDSLINTWANGVLANKPELVGFSIYDATRSVSLLLAEAIKKVSPETSIVFGGPSCDDKELILQGPIDYLVVGEGEQTITELIRCLEGNKPLENCPGLIFIKEDQIIRTDHRLPISDINSIPLPDFSEFDLTKYQPQLPMFTSRGCINRCSFCSESPRWGKYRYRTAENIVNEMERNLTEWGITHFSIEDSLINGNMGEFEKMCDLIISKDLKVTWGGKARINPRMDRAFLAKAYKAGCRGLIFGIESASQNVLNHMNKNVSISDVETVVINSHEAGINVGCFFVIGYVNESEEDFEKTLYFVKKNRKYIDTVYQGNGLHILKGSRLYNRAEEYGIVLPEYAPDGKWRTLDGKNTYEIRSNRLKRFNNLIAELYS